MASSGGNGGHDRSASELQKRAELLDKSAARRRRPVASVMSTSARSNPCLPFGQNTHRPNLILLETAGPIRQAAAPGAAEDQRRINGIGRELFPRVAAVVRFRTRKIVEQKPALQSVMSN